VSPNRSEAPRFNYDLQLTIYLVTSRACARSAPSQLAAEVRRWADLLPVYVTTVGDLYNDDERVAVADRVEHSIATLTYSVALLTGELLATGRTGRIGERPNPLDNPMNREFSATRTGWSRGIGYAMTP